MRMQEQDVTKQSPRMKTLGLQQTAQIKQRLQVSILQIVAYQVIHQIADCTVSFCVCMSLSL